MTYAHIQATASPEFHFSHSYVLICSLYLQFTTHETMIDFSIVAGNDFTAPYMVDLHSQLDFRGRLNVECFARWMRHYKRIENNPRLAEEMVGSYNRHLIA